MTNREIRQFRIMEFQSSEGFFDDEPVPPKDHLLLYMQDLKDEGNEFFKEQDYQNAWMFYSKALNVAMDLRMQYYVNVDPAFLSALFSNRAMCCLRLTRYTDAVQDCDWAITIDDDNIKAHYRKVLALKGMKEYRKALRAAEAGMKKQSSCLDIPYPLCVAQHGGDKAFFKDLILELQDLIAAQKSYPFPPPQRKGSQRVLLEVEDVSAEQEPDSDWLKGTNVHVTEEYLDRKTKMPQKKKKGKKTSGGGKKSVAEQVPKELTTEVSEDSDNVKGTLSGSESEENNRLETDEDFARSYCQIREESNASNSKNGQAKVLKQVTVSKKSKANLQSNLSSPSKALPGKKIQTSGASPSGKDKKSKCRLSEQQMKNLDLPISEEYDYKLACKNCFVKLREGKNGCRHIPNQKHPCAHDVLIVRGRQQSGSGWVKIRRRPHIKAQHFLGKFKLCQQYAQGMPCRWEEDTCTFCHNQAEVDLWTFDKEGSFSIDAFIKTATELKLYESSELKKAVGGGNISKQKVPGMLYKNERSKSCQLLNIELPYTLPQPPPIKKNVPPLNLADKIVEGKPGQVNDVSSGVPQGGNQTVDVGFGQVNNVQPSRIPDVEGQAVEAEVGQQVHKAPPSRVSHVRDQIVKAGFGQENKVPPHRLSHLGDQTVEAGFGLQVNNASPSRVPHVGDQTVEAGFGQQVNNASPSRVPHVGDQTMEAGFGQEVNKALPSRVPHLGDQTVGDGFRQVNGLSTGVPHLSDKIVESRFGPMNGLPSVMDKSVGSGLGQHTNGLPSGIPHVRDQTVESRFGQQQTAHVGDYTEEPRQLQEIDIPPSHRSRQSPALVLQGEWNPQTSVTFTNSSYSSQPVSYGADGPVVQQMPTLGSFWPVTLTDQVDPSPNQSHVLMGDFHGQPSNLTSNVPAQLPVLTKEQPSVMTHHIPSLTPIFPDRFLAEPPPPLPPVNQFQVRQAPPYQPIQSSVPKLTNPLKDKYDFKIVCSHCLCFTGFPGRYNYKNHTHKCEENVLAMICRTTKKWIRVRERTNHRDFPGNYKMCDSVTLNDPNLCKFREERCSFAHNEAEKQLWRLEKEEKWSVTEFIMQQRKVNTYGGYSAMEIISKHPGHFDFICRPCYFQNQLLSIQIGKVCSGPGMHRWDQYKTLAHFCITGVITLINKRGFTNKTAFFKICKNLHFCYKNVTGDCRFAHSFVERDVWMLERDTDITPEQIVLETSRVKSQPNGHGFSDLNAKTSESESKLEETPTVPEERECPYIIHKVCGLCFRNGSMKYQDGTKDQCSNRNKAHSMWNKNCIYINVAQKKEVRPLPNKIPANLNFVICQHIRDKKRCDYSLGGPCQFAHSQEEIKIWQWMVSNKVKTLEQLFKISQQSQKAKSDHKAEKLSAQSAVQTRVSDSSSVPMSTRYCWYCGVSCSGDKQWDEHRSSQKHSLNLNSDKEHPWNYREPPVGIEYKLCDKHKDGARCAYSLKPEMYNHCQFAHSTEELDEWHERYEWRKMKREMARQQKVYSYMDQLLERFNSAESGSSVMVESLDNVEIVMTGEKSVYLEKKGSDYAWVFEIRTSGAVHLEKVALLYNKDRLHFGLVHPGNSNSCQFAHGEVFVTPGPSENKSYSVRVQFSAAMFGSFNQWVVFDFGLDVVVVRKLQVEIGSRLIHEKIKHLRQECNFERWTGENRKIVRMPKVLDELEKHLLSRYKSPDSSESVLTQDMLVQELNRNNYTHRMSKLLQLEELTRHQIISRYNMYTTIELSSTITEGEFLCALPGELYAHVPLEGKLNEDTDAGELILTSVSHILMAPQTNSQGSVYEAAIVSTETGRWLGQNYVYIHLPAECCTALDLKHGDKLDVEIQFQLDRLVFCKMHYAVDQMAVNTDIIFPDLSQLPRGLEAEQTFEKRPSKLNPTQMSAVRHIVAKRNVATPPVVIFGPFGTGKTETLAEVAMLLLTERPDVRILICTEGNKSADLYIEKYLDPFMKRTGNEAKMLRLCAPVRRVRTVQPVVLQYCILPSTKDCFLIPSKEELMTYKVCIVTLDMSLHLVHAQMKGFFTHIFVDEAAQALECQAIKPLCLAEPSTCVVLTGDHMQLGPTVYCPQARHLKFDHSLLERLCSVYRETVNHIPDSIVPHILFNKNYRSKKEILQFIASVFYGGPETLTSESHIPSVSGVSPLTFYSVQGREAQEPDSTSYYNMAEVEEVVERVAELYNKWPKEWKPKDASLICVTASYTDQVRYIRRGLRRKSSELRGVSCERAQNIPGREFRAVFVSTVRTQHVGDTENLGFLSNPKLLNTALTRAQSLVAVVGNPISLCALGQCMTIWRAFLKQCQSMRSIHPPTLTMENIKQGVHNLLTSNVGTKLVQDAEKNRSSNRFPAMVPASQDSQDVLEASHGRTGNAGSSPEAASTTKQVSPVDPPGLTTGNFLDDWDWDYMLEPDDIIKQLAEQEVKSQLVELYEKAKKEGKAVDEGPGVGLSSPLKMQCIEIREQHGHAVISYPPLVEEVRKRKLLSADDAGKEYDSDSDKSDVEDEGRREIHNDFTHEELVTLLESQSDEYVRCILHCDSRRLYAEVLSKESKLAEVEISCRKRCGRAFHGDEVVVRILPKEDMNCEASASDAEIVHGEVVGILKRNMDPQYRLFVCTVEPKNTGVMIPLNRGIPRIYNLSRKTQLKKSRKDVVQVYKFMKDKTIVPHDSVKVGPQDADKQLFVVRYLKWDAKCPLPLGIVVDVIPPGSNVENGMVILNIEYQIPKRYSPETERFVQEQKSSYIQLPPEVLENRLDYRDKIVITIDPPFSTDLDDALSLETLPDDRYLVGVHIADVSYFIPPNSAIDREAEGRGVSFYPMIQETIHMLHPYFSTNVCSLLPDTDRLTVSVFFTVSSEGEILSVDPERCIIKAKRLSYTDVEELLHDSETPHKEVRNRLLALGKLAQIWRYQRLGNAHLSQQLDVESQESPHAHLLVEELMIMTNHQMGKLLMKYFPDCTPLRQQEFPHPAALEKWKETHAASAANTVALTRPFLEGYSICKCKRACTCVLNFMMRHKIRVPEEVSLLTSTWEAMSREADAGNYRAVQEFIFQAEYHPNQMIAQLQLYTLQERAVYVCSGSLNKEDAGHYSLNLPHYVHFTSPIRRYIDLVAQRLVCALIDRKPCPYSQADVERLCRKTTNASLLASRYHKACSLLQLAAALKEMPMVVYPSVEEVSEEDVKLQIPSVAQIPSPQRQIKLSLLTPSRKPVLQEEQRSVTVHWQHRIYELPAHNTKKIKILPEDTIKLNPDKFVCKVSAYHWQHLLCAARQPVSGKIVDGMQLSTKGNLPAVFESMKDSVKCVVKDEAFEKEVTSEVKEAETIVRHLRNFSTEFQKFAVLKAQVTSTMYHGMLSPTLHLLSLTPRLDVCLEHHRDPVFCFASGNAKQASRLNYNNEQAYKAAWLPVLSMESAVSSVGNQDSLFVHNVCITWHKTQSSNGLEVRGEFFLPISFCKERQIKFSNSPGDYLCIRYPELSLPENTDLPKDVAAVVNNGQPVTWTCHCWITNVMPKEKEDKVHFECRLHKSAVPFPAILHETGSPSPLCTVEWIPRFLPVRRMEDAVLTFDKNSQLAQDIAVGRTPVAPVNVSDIPKLTAVPIPGLPPPNRVQMDAVMQALRQPFSLIQGPPGTGKTLMGTRLAFLFAQRNRSINAESAKQPQVLYCGPSNKSVDVVAGYLKKLGPSCPKLVRVYSENIERKEFPLPRDPIPPKRQSGTASASADPTLKDIALHHLIRQPSCGYSILLCMYDEHFARCPENISDEEVEEYKRLVTEAEIEEIKSAEILLCTCSVSSSPRMTYGSWVSQVIIDECGMCTEPDSMIPIVNTNPSQVVLIGDHKQLRPIVACQQAKDLGLETSLFERYAKKAIMLTYQYRMHKGIAQFPSYHFYDGKLKCGTRAQICPAELDIWPSGRGSPIALCHVKGEEETLTVSTEEGSERSKSNQKEAYLAVHIVSALVRQFSVKETNIKVLSQYRAQCGAIQRELTKQGLHNTGVNTVISSQGSEWDYVILSTVRTLPPDEIERTPTEGWKRRHLGFITDDHQINVAITRAKKGLFIIGDKQLLECDQMWKRLIAHYKKEKKLIEEPQLRELLSRQGR